MRQPVNSRSRFPSTPRPLSPGSAPPARRGQISGTYSGRAGEWRLQLRVDMDGSRPLNVLSGDLFASAEEDGSPKERLVASFACPNLEVQKRVTETVVAGEAQFSTGQRVRLEADIPTTPASHGSLTVQFRSFGWVGENTFSCRKVSDTFRSVEMEVQRMEGVEPLKPLDLGSTHPRPQELPRRTASLPSCFEGAGIAIKVKEGPIIATRPEAAIGWSRAEIHAVMEKRYPRLQGDDRFLLIADRCEDPDIGGLAYDSGEGRHPASLRRHGAVLFKEYLRNNVPSGELERAYLVAAVHEAGHCFGLPHPFEGCKAVVPASSNYGSLTFMNYPSSYNNGREKGREAFYTHFTWQFDDDELLQLRHKATPSAVAGGDPAECLLQMAEPMPISNPQNEQPASLELSLRMPTSLRLGELLTLELKLKNASPNAPCQVYNYLHPEDGLMSILVRRPPKGWQVYRPLFTHCRFAPKTSPLSPGESFFTAITVSYARDGFLFQEPGEHQMMAIYQAGDGRFIQSDIQRVWVHYPTAEEEEIAKELFSREVGHTLYLGGTEAFPETREKLLALAERHPSFAGSYHIFAQEGMLLAEEFKKIDDGMMKVRPREPERAIGFLKRAVELDPTKRKAHLHPLLYERVVDRLVDCLITLGMEKEAHGYLDDMVAFFLNTGVKSSAVALAERKARVLAR